MSANTVTTSLTNPLADPRPLVRCDNCGSTRYRDKPIHNGRSIERVCTRCTRFMGFVKWNGINIQGVGK